MMYIICKLHSILNIMSTRSKITTKELEEFFKEPTPMITREEIEFYYLKYPMDHLPPVKDNKCKQSLKTKCD